MAGNNDFKPFSTGVGANVLTQAAYELLATLRADGFQSGIAISEQFNKVWRQANIPGVALTDLVALILDEDVLDDGDVAALMNQMASTISLLGSSPDARIVTTSTNFTLDMNDGVVGLNRTSGPAATQITLPTPNFIGKTFTIEDLAGNFFTYNVTVVPPVGMTIAGLATAVLNTNRQSATFRYYGSNLWGVKF